MDKVEKLKLFLRENPADGFLKHALALEYVKAGDDVEARNTWEELLKEQPGYVGSYYHLGKLHERAGDEPGAVRIYEKGMEAAKLAGDNHALGELRTAWEYLAF